jgi:hypothetical protein
VQPRRAIHRSRTLRVGIIDVVAKQPEKTLYARIMNANLASIMPQVLAVWCRRAGHDVRYFCFTGGENLHAELPRDVDIVFLSAFTEAAQLVYALSNLFRSRGAVTALGGPHARCYPQDARLHFDYVFGFTNENLVRDVLADCSPHRPEGLRVEAPRQPLALPGVRERWPYVRATLRKAPFLKMVPILGSLGCPYTCPFCIDAAVPYQPLDFDGLGEDLRFLMTKFRRPLLAWHDPNFGVRFDDYLGAIERAGAPGRIRSVAEMSLSLLSEPRLRRMRRAGFHALLPGVESWFALGNKSSSGGSVGMDKVQRVSAQVRTLLRHVPYVQANFVLGLDCDEGSEPFELTKRFLDRTPGVFPGYSLLSAFGQAAKLNLDYQRDGRVLPFPFFLLNNNQAMNVRPAHYAWTEFYDRVIDLTTYSFSPRRILDRMRGTLVPGASGAISRAINVVRAISSEGRGRLRYYREIRRRLDEDAEFRPYFEQETTRLPTFFVDMLHTSLGSLWRWLPPHALEHDPHAYLKEQVATAAPEPSFASRSRSPRQLVVRRPRRPRPDRCTSPAAPRSSRTGADQADQEEPNSPCPRTSSMWATCPSKAPRTTSARPSRRTAR